jgi:Nuclease-related domain/PBS lyase HEAT-like repeat
MPFLIYRCGYLSEEHERIQMGRLLGYLEQGFAGRNEDCAIIIEPTIPFGENETKPDAIIVKDNVFVLIDLKAFEGDIIADCSYGGVWRSKDGQQLADRNPFSQSGYHRFALLDFLRAGFVNSGNAPRWALTDDYATDDWIRRHVQSWIITAEASRPTVTGVDTRKFPSFKVIPVESVANSLILIRSPQPLMGLTDFRHFLDKLNATRTNRSEWLRGALVEVEDQNSFQGMNAQVTSWIDSGQHGEITRALSRIREMDLKVHVNDVVRICRDKRFADLRKEALLILIDWRYGALGKILDEALRDPEAGIVKFALEYLAGDFHAEASATLLKMLNVGPSELNVLVIKAIAASGQESACLPLWEFVQKNLVGTPFKNFQRWFERAERSMSGDGKKYEEFSQLDRKRLALLELTRTAIQALGDLNCRSSIRWLKTTVDGPTSIGFESNDYNVLQEIGSDYYSIFASACESLAKIGISDSSVRDLLLKRLGASPEVYQDCIIRALGNLGDEAAAPALLQFIRKKKEPVDEDPYDPLYDVAVSALSKLRSVEAFDKLKMFYLEDPLSNSGRWTGEALENMDRKKFEKLLLASLASEGISNKNKEEFLRALLPIASLDSADALFSLLSNPRLSDFASWILSNLSKDDSVFKRAMALTDSPDPVEKAGAISVLSDYYIANPHELERFESLSASAPVEVRRVVAALYSASKCRERILRYAADADPLVRSEVFNFFAEERHCGEYIFSSTLRTAARCKIIVDQSEGNIVVSLPQKIEIFPQSAVEKACLMTKEPDEQGVYLRVRVRADLLEEVLLVPLDKSGSLSCSSEDLLGSMKLTESVRMNAMSASQNSQLFALWPSRADFEQQTPDEYL